MRIAIETLEWKLQGAKDRLEDTDTRRARLLDRAEELAVEAAELEIQIKELHEAIDTLEGI